MSHPSDTPHSAHVVSRSRKALRSYIIQAATLLEIVLSGLVLIGLLLSFIPLLKWMRWRRRVRNSSAGMPLWLGVRSGAGLPSGRWAPKAGTKKNLRTTKINAMAPTLMRLSRADSWPTTMWRAMA